jgi:NADPH:quinone reductase-like Zn-dependent oxidoreductase
VPQPEPGAGQLLVRVKAAGVRQLGRPDPRGQSGTPTLPIILDSELLGVVEAIGSEVSGFKVGDEVYGATNGQFSGAYAEYALASARMIAQKPKTLELRRGGLGSNRRHDSNVWPPPSEGGALFG